jgi:hypothetical protein
LGHLRFVQNDYEHFVHFAFHNEIFWCNECTYIPVVGQMAMLPSTSSLGCKLDHAPPLCVIDYSGRIYYVLHRL